MPKQKRRRISQEWGKLSWLQSRHSKADATLAETMSSMQVWLPQRLPLSTAPSSGSPHVLIQSCICRPSISGTIREALGHGPCSTEGGSLIAYVDPPSWAKFSGRQWGRSLREAPLLQNLSINLEPKALPVGASATLPMGEHE